MKRPFAPVVLALALLFCSLVGRARAILIPMDEKQANHLKAYGIAYNVLKADSEVEWLLNYRGGSFMIPYTNAFDTECRVRGVTMEVISDADAAQIRQQLTNPDLNADVVKLVKAAKIVVYSPIKVSTAEFENTDAVLLVLNYAEIPYEVVYDEEILKGELPKYDWLHLHHEDFTGQFGRSLHRMSADDIKAQETIASKYGFAKVSQMKLAVAKRVRDFLAGGGYLFAMCSGAETFDIALAAEGVDIVGSQYDGDDSDPNAQSKLDFNKTLAFHNFTLEGDGGGYRGFSSFSDINSTVNRGGWDQATGFFELFDFSAKWDVIPAMLTQNHEHIIKEFHGQTTAFRKTAVKSNVLVMGTGKTSDRYIYGEAGRYSGQFSDANGPESTPSLTRLSADSQQRLVPIGPEEKAENLDLFLNNPIGCRQCPWATRGLIG
jgi:hypothetical protein